MDVWGGGYWSNSGGSDPGDENPSEPESYGVPGDSEPVETPQPEPDYREMARWYRRPHDCGYCNTWAAFFCVKCEGVLGG